MWRYRPHLSAVTAVAALLALGSCDDAVEPDRGPVANPATASTSNRNTVTVTLTGTHPQGADLEFAIASGPENGTLDEIMQLTAKSAEVVYSPRSDFVGEDRFTFTVSDDVATSEPAAVTITVTANVRPNAGDRFAVTVEAEAVTVTLTATDRDRDGLTFSIVEAPNNGTLGAISQATDTTARVAYTPDAGFVGSDQFTFSASDGADTSLPGNATVFVTSALVGRITANGPHTCALNASDVSFCWGDNDFGQLGDGTIVDHRTTPVSVGGSVTFSRLAAGIAHTCGLTASGQAFCWGSNRRGQLGDGTMGDPKVLPVAVSGDRTFVQLVAGAHHTCGLTPTGEVYCWGDNRSGELGDGTEVELRLTPVLVDDGRVYRYLAAGSHHTCGLDDTGRAFCWGANDNAQLGDGTIDARRIPTPVSGDDRYVQLAAHYYHTCGLDETGSVFCWGSDPSALGDGSRVLETEPQPVLGGPPLLQIAAGGDHDCGLDAAGLAICWGVNDDGELGVGNTTGDDCGGVPPCRNTPEPVNGGHIFVWLASGQDHVCGLQASGQVLCWGRNIEGQLGDGTTEMRTVPTPVADPF